MSAARRRHPQFVPLGNGGLGAAVWAAGGFAAQLSRAETFPDRGSPGPLVIPGLARLTGAPDFHGYLDRYDGVLHESGGGMTLTAYLRADNAQLACPIGAWETFDVLDEGNGNIALRSRADNRIVTAESAGARPLIANRTAVGPWEEFDLVND
jgi:hypothetical protein